MFGFINLNKPAGFTSHDCVAKMRRLLNTKKIGHGGTLDPAATGVLPIAVGKATRLLQFLPDNKAYRARIRLGVTTTTDDLEGEILATASEVDLNPEKVAACLNNFIGTIEQVPPIYSAIKRDGKKLYELARKGENVEVTSRTITISNIKLIKFIAGDFPEVEVDIACSPGTYIRAIARDLGAMLNVGGTLANLIRTESCGLNLDRSLTFADIETKLQHGTLTSIEPQSLLTHLLVVSLNDADALRWCQGQLITISDDVIGDIEILSADEEKYLVTYQENRIFLGISLLLKSDHIFKLKPKVVCENLAQTK